MSKLIYLIARQGTRLPFGGEHIEQVSLRLTPDNITPSQPRIIEGEGILIGIVNPADRLPVRGCSVCLGALFDRCEDWWRPGASVPDGSYALFRSDGESIELVSDIVASRTIWYAQTEALFIASTSQRAIVCFLQSYEPNEAVYAWMLSSGTLGPGLSWDRRIRCLGGDSRLMLNRRTWSVELAQTPVVFAPEDLPKREHERRLREAIEQTFEHLDLDLGKWLLPLSGGYDSRAILLMIRDRSRLKTVTWGLKLALQDKDSDAWMARELAQCAGVPNAYFETDLADEPVATILRRFLLAGEGRTDGISGYMDGFAVWKRLHESGCQGVLRGDEVFGARPVRDDREVYRNMSLLVLSDFPNQDIVGGLAAGQRRPASLERRPAESREQWRDRVNTEFELPFLFAPLSDLKLPYVEIIQPLLSRRILQRVRSLPDGLRTGKSLFKKIVTGMEPNVGYAKRAAVESLGDILAKDAILEVVTSRLKRSASENEPIAGLSRRALGFMQETGSPTAAPTSMFWRVKRRLGLPGNPIPPMHPHKFSFRTYLIAEFTDILAEDAAVLKKSQTRAIGRSDARIGCSEGSVDSIVGTK